MENRKPVRKVGLVIVLSNIFLVAIKLAAWQITGSLSVLSEMANSMLDTFYALIVVGGLYISMKGPTKRFPEGLRRLEPFVGLFVAMSIALTSVYLIFLSASSLLTRTGNVESPTIGVLILLLSVIIKIFVYRYVLKESEKNSIPTFRAIAIDSRNDAATASAAVIGVIGVLVGQPMLDPIVAIIVAVVIAYSSLKLLYEHLGYILARAPSKEEQQRIVNAAMNFSEVYGVHDVSIHYDGPQIEVSMHIEVPGGMSVEEAHSLEVAVADRIREVCENDINEINLHVDPDSLDEWKDN